MTKKQDVARAKNWLTYQMKGSIGNLRQAQIEYTRRLTDEERSKWRISSEAAQLDLGIQFLEDSIKTAEFNKKIAAVAVTRKLEESQS